MVNTILFLAIAVFVGYALYTQYSKTPSEDGVPKRVITSLIAAAAAAGAVFMSWFQSGGVTP